MADPLEELERKYGIKPKTAAPKEDALTELERKYGLAKAQGAQQEQKPKPSAGEVFMNTPIMQGLTDPVVKLMQMGGRTLPKLLEWAGADPEVARSVAEIGTREIDKYATQREQKYQDVMQRVHGGEGLGASMSRGFAQTAPLAAATAGLGTPASWAGRIGLGALEGSAAGALQPAVTPGEQADFWGQTRSGALTGGITGAVAPVALEGVYKGLAPVVRKVQGMRAGMVRPEAEAFVREAEKRGITDWTADQALQTRVPRKIADATREIPLLGDAKKLAEGRKQVGRAITRMEEDWKSKMLKAGYTGQEELAQAAARRDPNAIRILEKSALAGDSAEKILIDDLERMGKIASDVVGEEYSKIGRQLQGTGDVDLTGLADKLRSTIERERKTIGGNQALVGEAEKLLQQIEDPSISKDWTSLRQATSNLGNDAEKYAIAGDDYLSKTIGEWRRDIRSAQDAHVKSLGRPELTSALEAANKLHQDIKLPYSVEDIAAVKRAIDPDSSVLKLIDTPGFEDKASRVYSLLGPKGKDAFDYMLLKRGINQSMDNEGRVSFAKLGTFLNKRRQELGVTLKGEKAAEMEGLQRILAHMENAPLGEAIFQNGRSLQKGLMLTGAVVSPKTALVAGTAGLLSKYLLQGPGKKWLVAAQKVTPGSKMMDDIVARAFRGMAAPSGAFAANEMTPKVEED